MRKNLILLYYLLFFLLTISFCADGTFAATPVIHKAPKPSWILPCKSYDKKPLSRNIQDGAYNELVEEQINVEKHATYNHIITRIVSESGVQDNSEITVSFDPSFEQVDFHEIVIWRNNKPQDRLSVRAFKMLPDENELDKFIYDGTYSAKLILPDVRKGDRIEYSYTLTGQNPIFGNKFCRSVYLQGSELIMHQYTTLLVSSARKLNVKSFNLLSSPKITEVDNLKRYEWEDFQVPGILTNDFQPKWVNQYARAQFSEYNNWGEVVEWGLSINPIRSTFTGELADTVGSLRKRFGNNKEKYFRAAVTLVQDEIRYMGIEIGPYSNKANAPEKVFKQRYGDCKDKSLLLASILNANGIEANMALLNTELKDKISDYIPSSKLFDHAVVVAMVNGKQVWVDATVSNQRGKGTDLYFPPYRKALILKPGNSTLTDIPETKTGKIICIEKYKIKDEISPVKLRVTTIYTLNQADDIRDEIASDGITKTEKNYLNYYSKTYSKIEAADSIKVKDDEVKNELTITESYIINNFFKYDTTSAKYSADFYADYINNKLPDINGQIKTPVSLNYPHNIDYTIMVTLPTGWDMSDEHDAISRSAYTFSSSKKVSGEDLSLNYQFAILKDDVSLDELPQFKKDLKDLKDDKLQFSFYYIPDIKKTPFKVNYLMLVITLIVICGSIYGSMRVYKHETDDSPYFNRNSLPPPLGGWLIWLVIMLFGTGISILAKLANDGYYGMAKWDFITAGTLSLIYKWQLAFEVLGYISFVCFTGFCLVLVLKKRDIAPHYLKTYYMGMVIFLFIDYFFNALVQQKFSDYDIQQIIGTVVVSALWTYYINTSPRVQQTFIVPYHK